MGIVLTVNKERLVSQGHEIYQHRLKSHGQIVAIEVESGDYF